MVAGDGTTSVVVICGSLLKKAQELLDKGVHPTVISDSFNKAAQKACEVRAAAWARCMGRCKRASHRAWASCVEHAVTGSGVNGMHGRAVHGRLSMRLFRWRCVWVGVRAVGDRAVAARVSVWWWVWCSGGGRVVVDRQRWAGGQEVR